MLLAACLAVLGSTAMAVAGPTIRSVAVGLGGWVKVGKWAPVRVDVDRRPDISRRYNQGGFPSVAILDGERAISASYDNTLRLWDLEFGNPSRPFMAIRIGSGRSLS